MLERLTIENIAIIDRAEIGFGAGLNILTGETGAGKSIVMDSIHAVLGGRSSRELIRAGQEKAFVEAVFRFPQGKEGISRDLINWFEQNELFPEEDGMFLVSRELTESGRNICRINGRTATVSLLRSLGALLVDIHGQHDNQSLLDVKNHQILLDDFSGKDLEIRRKAFKTLITKFRRSESALRQLISGARQRERDMDLLRYEINEINEAGLKKGEDENLARQREFLIHQEKINHTLNYILSILQGEAQELPVSSVFSNFRNRMQELASFDAQFSSWAGQFEDISCRLEDLSDEIRHKLKLMDTAPGLLERVEERLDLLRRLKRKYGDTIENIIDYGKSAATKLEQISTSEEETRLLESDLAAMRIQLREIADEISRIRKEAAVRLEKTVSSQLKDLEMKGTRFHVDIRDREDGYDENGADLIEFLFSSNTGEPVKPLARIASGGEMSRVMLAVKTILADVDQLPVLVFDEIDMGIGGRAAAKVAEKLSYISRNHQVICVTHLAQIACMADTHLLVEKSDWQGHTQTVVRKLNEPDIVAEIGRLLDGGNLSEITLKHAQEMLSNAKSNSIRIPTQG